MEIGKSKIKNEKLEVKLDKWSMENKNIKISTKEFFFENLLKNKQNNHC
jgi:hypothetical protein